MPLPTPERPAVVGRETYTLEQFAKLLGIGKTVAYERAKAGDLPVEPIRIGPRYLYPRAKVDRLLGLDTSDADTRA